MGYQRSRNLFGSDDAARRAYAIGKFLQGKLLRGRQALLGGCFGIFAAWGGRRFALPITRKFRPVRVHVASPGVGRRARSRESVPSRLLRSKPCARILGALRFKGLQFMDSFSLKR